MYKGKDGPHCVANIEGPKVGRHVVAWRRRCKNRPTRGSEYCWVHNPGPLNVMGSLRLGAR